MELSLGTMSVDRLFDWHEHAGKGIEQVVAAFVEYSEAVASRWIQTANGVMLLQMVPGDPSSGAIYLYDRRQVCWYMLGFEGDDQFTAEKFDQVFSEYELFRLVEQPGLLLASQQMANA
jgi:hypothetical protein